MVRWNEIQFVCVCIQIYCAILKMIRQIYSLISIECKQMIRWWTHKMILCCLNTHTKKKLTNCYLSWWCVDATARQFIVAIPFVISLPFSWMANHLEILCFFLRLLFVRIPSFEICFFIRFLLHYYFIVKNTFFCFFFCRYTKARNAIEMLIEKFLYLYFVWYRFAVRVCVFVYAIESLNPIQNWCF